MAAKKRENDTLELNCDSLIKRIPALSDAPKAHGMIVSYWVMGYSVEQISRYMNRDQEEVSMIVNKYDPDCSLKSDEKFANLQTQRNAQRLRDYCLLQAIEAASPEKGLLLKRVHLTKLAHGWRITANQLGDKSEAAGMKRCASDLEQMVQRGIVGDPDYYVNLVVKLNELIKRTGPNPDMAENAEDALKALTSGAAT